MTKRGTIRPSWCSAFGIRTKLESPQPTPAWTATLQWFCHLQTPIFMKARTSTRRETTPRTRGSLCPARARNLPPARAAPTPLRLRLPGCSECLNWRKASLSTPRLHRPSLSTLRLYYRRTNDSREYPCRWWVAAGIPLVELRQVSVRYRIKGELRGKPLVEAVWFGVWSWRSRPLISVHRLHGLFG